MKLFWDLDTQRFYETGTRNGVLYPKLRDGTYPLGVAWNGLTGVTETPEGGEPNDFYADDMKYLTLMSVETFGGTISAYTYPDEWAECDGFVETAEGVVLNQQARHPFGLCFRTILGNDSEMNDYNYKLHLIYNALVSPSERSYTTVNDSPEPIEFSWDFTTTPINVEGYKPLSLITIDSSRTDPALLLDLERKLYGTDPDSTAGTSGSDPYLPLPNEVIASFNRAVSYSAIASPTGDPWALGYFENVGGTGTTWIRSKDRKVNASKTYYNATF